MTKPLTIDDITELDSKGRVVTHKASGLQLGWPETPPQKFATLFRLIFQGNGLEFLLQWELKKSEGEFINTFLSLIAGVVLLFI